MKYVYIYLNPLKPGNFKYKNLEFKHEPFYVGMGSGDRYKMHKFKCNLKGRSHKINIIKKILKNDTEPIILKLYDNLSNEQAKELEIETIKNIGRKDLKQGPLSNRTDGGDSTGYKHNKNSLIKSMNPILCYDLNMKFIKEYDSIQSASDELNITRSNISQCCRYLFNVCHKKHVFRYKDKKMNEKYKDKNIKYRVIRIDYKGVEKKYRRIRDAVIDNNISANTIVSVCQGKYLCGGGYLWRYTHYSDEFYENIESHYNFKVDIKVLDNYNNVYENSLHASVETGYRLYTICKNLEDDYNLNNIKFEYIN